MCEILANVKNIFLEIIKQLYHIFNRFEAAVWALAATLISIFLVNGYRFGLSDQAITIPFVKSYLNPNLYPGDELVAQKQYFMTFFWEVVSWFVRDDFGNLAGLFFALYMLSVFLFFLFIYKFSWLLFQNRLPAILAVGFLIFRFETAGHVNSIELLLYTRQVTAFMLIAAIYYFFLHRFYLSFIFLAVAFLIHPLSAVYGWLLLLTVYLFKWKQLGAQKWLGNLVVPIIIMSLLFVKKGFNPLPEPIPFFADKDWLDLLRLRSAHHIFPSMWEGNTFALLFLTIVVYLIGATQVIATVYKKYLWQFTIAFLVMFFAGWFFVEVVPVSLAVQFQFFRSSKLLFYLAVILVAGTWWKMLTNGNYTLALLLSFLSYGLFDLAGYPLYNYLFVLFVLATIGVIAVGIYQKKWAVYAMYAGSALMIGLAIYRSYGPLADFTIQNRQSAQWLEAQAWARQHTPVNAVFISPPDKEGFRVGSERSIYGDWKEGTQMFFNPSFGPDWIKKMENLGFNRVDTSFHYIDDVQQIKSLASLINQKRKAPVYYINSMKIEGLTAVFEGAEYKIYLAKE